MKITINYDSCWRNSFLDGSNNEPLPKNGKGRKFIGSMISLRRAENFIPRKIEHSTVMGVLNRLIGDQRKLYQAIAGDNYYFKTLEHLVTFEDIDAKRIVNDEMTYIRNITGSTDQNSYTGMVKVRDPMFLSDYSPELWGILALDFVELCDFIICNQKVSKAIQADPLSIISRLEVLNKEKPVVNEGQANKAMDELHKTFPEINYLNRKADIVPISLYCSALYLQLERLSKQFDVSSAKTKRGMISGISKRGFTKKDFMNRFTTGEKKKIWGNPYLRKQRVKGIGEVTSMMTKASGVLEITLDIDKNSARSLKKMINNAGVSSFYLGKKGLAYIERIRI